MKGKDSWPGVLLVVDAMCVVNMSGEAREATSTAIGLRFVFVYVKSVRGGFNPRKTGFVMLA